MEKEETVGRLSCQWIQASLIMFKMRNIFIIDILDFKPCSLRIQVIIDQSFGARFSTDVSIGSTSDQKIAAVFAHAQVFFDDLATLGTTIQLNFRAYNTIYNGAKTISAAGNDINE